MYLYNLQDISWWGLTQSFLHQDKWHRLPSMIPTSSVNKDGREDVLKFISSIILFRRRKNAEAKEARRRQKVKVRDTFIAAACFSCAISFAGVRIPFPLNLSIFIPQAAKAQKPQKHRVRKSEREGQGSYIPNSPSSNPTAREPSSRKPEKQRMSVKEMIAQELGEIQRGE